MWQYIVILIILLIFVYFHDIKGYQRGRQAALFISFIMLWLIIGLRYKMGGDALFYEREFPLVPNFIDILTRKASYPYQPLWIILNNISPTYLSFQILHAFLVNLCLFIFFSRYTEKVFSALFAICFSALHLYYCFEIQREILAICIFLLNIENLQKEKWVDYYAFACISLLFHISAIFIFIIPLFKKLKCNWVFITICFVSMVLLYILKPYILNLAIAISPAKIAERVSAYQFQETTRNTIIYFFLVRCVLAIPLCLCIPSKFNWTASATILISMFSVVILGSERFLNYLYPVLIVLLINLLYEEKTAPKLFRQCFIIFSALYLFCIVDLPIIRAKTDSNKPYSCLYFPYYSIFDKETADPAVIQLRKDFRDEAMEAMFKEHQKKAAETE